MKDMPLSAKHADKLLLVLVVTLVFSVMNGTMFNVALPDIGEEFQLGPSQVSWMMTSYMVVYAIGSIIMGKLADKYRLKDLLTYGLLIFAVGSFIGFFASNFWVIILGRVIQAAGASVLPAAAMIIPVRYFPPEKRGRALGTSAIGIALGNALGPVAAGVLTGLGNWRLMFILSLLPLLLLPFFRKYLDNTRGTAGRIDIIGGALLALFVASVLLSITQSSMLFVALAAIGFIGFIIRIRTAEEPFIQPALFKNMNYSVGILLAFITTAMSFGMTFITPQFLAQIHGLSASSIGFVLVPAAIAAAIFGRQGGKIADARGTFTLVLLAASLLFIAFTTLSTFISATAFVIALLLIFGNVGQTFMQVAMSHTVSRTLAKEHTGVGMGLLSMVNFIAGAISMSIIGKLLESDTPSISFNPFVTDASTFIYSNIFFVMALFILVAVGIYRKQFK